TRSTDHQTKVIEEDHTYYVNQSPLELIKLNCLLNGSDFTGRAKSIAYHLNFKRMSPVAINKRIHAFPTHSLADCECMWILEKQILRCYAVSNLFEHIQSEPVKGVKIIN